MSDRDKIKQYLRKEMRKIITLSPKIEKTTFAFCWGQAKFDTLMDIDIKLKLGTFYKPS